MCLYLVLGFIIIVIVVVVIILLFLVVVVMILLRLLRCLLHLHRLRFGGFLLRCGRREALLRGWHTFLLVGTTGHGSSGLHHHHWMAVTTSLRFHAARIAVVSFGFLRQQFRTNLRQNTTLRCAHIEASECSNKLMRKVDVTDRDAIEQFVQFFIIPNGQLKMSRDDPFLFIVSSGIAR